MSRTLVVVIAAIAGALSGAAGSYLVLRSISSSEPKAVMVREIRVVGENGRLLAYLGHTKGAPQLFLYSENGEPQLHLGVSSSGPLISLTTDNLSSSIGIMIDEKGPRIGVYDSSGFVAINLPSHKPGLVINRKEPKFTWRSPTE
jgi:hypothetical protein